MMVALMIMMLVATMVVVIEYTDVNKYENILVLKRMTHYISDGVATSATSSLHQRRRRYTSDGVASPAMYSLHRLGMYY